jgi:hypothetical protein
MFEHLLADSARLQGSQIAEFTRGRSLEEPRRSRFEFTRGRASGTLRNSAPESIEYEKKRIKKPKTKRMDLARKMLRRELARKMLRRELARKMLRRELARKMLRRELARKMLRESLAGGCRIAAQHGPIAA